MITSLFRKSTLLNYSAVIIGVVVFFFLCQIHGQTSNNVEIGIVKRVLLLILILASLFIANFIVKKKCFKQRQCLYGLVLFYLIVIFPSTLSNFNLIVSNFFILLALRRLISLQSPRAPKKKYLTLPYGFL